MSAPTADEVGLPDWVLEALRSIGLTDPDPEDSLHVRLVNAVLNLGPGAAEGVQLTAMRWQINWVQKDAGEVFAKAKTDYEHHIDRRTVRLRAESEKMSRAEAEQIARSEDRAYELKLEHLLAEKREQSLRKMLDTIENQVDVWRTTRADERGADRAHAQGYSGGA